MASIEQARKTASDFLVRSLNPKDVKVVRAAKVGDCWETEAEVYEESSFIKSIGLPTKVQDRNLYSVRLSDNLEILGYEKRREGEEKEKPRK